MSGASAEIGLINGYDFNAARLANLRFKTALLAGSKDNSGRVFRRASAFSDIGLQLEKGIISLLPSLRINTSTLGRYFLYKNRFFGSSFFNGVRELAPGAVFTFSDIDAWTFSESRTWQEYYSMSLLDSLSRFSRFRTGRFFP